ncbi:RNA-binding protein [Lachnospiraceae bacterium RM5]|nr:RNA-binding protein [Lachnospiraceae bacterium RM5]
MTSKERAYLKKMALDMPAIYQVGKAIITPELTNGIDEALEARELIKINVLKNCMDTPKNIANVLAERTKAEVVQVIGRKIILYRKPKDNKSKYFK